MKKILAILILIICSFGQIEAQQTGGNSSVEVFYFHGKRRCATCQSIETNAAKTVELYLKNEKAKGRVKMTVIDIDDKKNKALVEKYEVSSSSLFVTRTTAGKTFTQDMTNFAFSYSKNDPDKFMKGLKEKITESLNK